MSNLAARQTLVRMIVISAIAISIVTSLLAIGLPDGKPLMGAAILNALIGLGVLFREPASELVARISGSSPIARDS
jgi:hypothetical protein